MSCDLLSPRFLLQSEIATSHMSMMMGHLHMSLLNTHHVVTLSVVTVCLCSPHLTVGLLRKGLVSGLEASLVKEKNSMKYQFNDQNH